MARDLNEHEVKIIERLLQLDFPGRDELLLQVRNCQVIELDSNGSLGFSILPCVEARTRSRIPVEATIVQDDEIVHILLHVEEGRLKELEVFREDLGQVRQPIDADKLDILVN